MGSGDPIIQDDKVSFNGEDEYSRETFTIVRNFVPRYDSERPDKDNNCFAFCKTGYNPYDKIVTACLTRFKHHFPDVNIHSDGETNDWADGMNICQSLFGKVDNPLSKG